VRPTLAAVLAINLGWLLVHLARSVRRDSTIWAAMVVLAVAWRLVGRARLMIRHDGSEFVPSLRRARCAGCRDQLLVGLLAGQTPADWEKRTDALAHAFRALSCRVRVHRPGEVWLDLAYADPRAARVPALPIGQHP
jgi:DNA segregation ATPase FtsK/SpoIIIE, S-DNA-T family